MRRAERSTKAWTSGWLARALLCVAWVLGSGCGGPDPCAALSGDAAAHTALFERFVGVAERVADSDSAFEERAHLEESLFVSLRSEPTVLAAWVERQGPAPLTVAFPPRAPTPNLAWLTCRMPGGARLEAGRAALHIGEAPGPAFFLRRRVTREPQTLVITVAFVDDALPQ